MACCPSPNCPHFLTKTTCRCEFIRTIWLNKFGPTVFSKVWATRREHRKMPGNSASGRPTLVGRTQTPALLKRQIAKGRKEKSRGNVPLRRSSSVRGGPDADPKKFQLRFRAGPFLLSSGQRCRALFRKNDALHGRKAEQFYDYAVGSSHGDGF